jgi:hypothetical protein
LSIEFDQAEEIHFASYDFALGYNQLIPASSLIILFKGNTLPSRIKLNQ